MRAFTRGLRCVVGCNQPRTARWLIVKIGSCPGDTCRFDSSHSVYCFVIRLLAVGAVHMQAFSAADVISPAIRRTRWFLFEPFRWSTFLKLCLVSLLTEGGSSGGNFNAPRSHHSSSSSSVSYTHLRAHETGRNLVC